MKTIDLCFMIMIFVASTPNETQQWDKKIKEFYCIVSCNFISCEQTLLHHTEALSEKNNRKNDLLSVGWDFNDFPVLFNGLSRSVSRMLRLIDVIIAWISLCLCTNEVFPSILGSLRPRDDYSGQGCLRFSFYFIRFYYFEIGLPSTILEEWLNLFLSSNRINFHRKIICFYFLFFSAFFPGDFSIRFKMGRCQSFMFLQCSVS